MSGHPAANGAWQAAAADLEEALAVIDAALAERDWSRLARVTWAQAPPMVAGGPGPAARGRLASLALKLAELRERVETDLTAVEAELADVSERRQTRYADQSALAVTEGQVVAAGEVIGFVGSTGLSTVPHLHFEVRRHGEGVDPEPLLAGT